MNKTEIIIEYFFDLSKKELNTFQFDRIPRGFVCNNFVFEGFSITVDYLITLRIKTIGDLTIEDTHRLIQSKLSSIEGRVFFNGSKISIYPSLKSRNMSAPKHAIWQIDCIKKLELFLKELKGSFIS
jgi:hypothetical protein